ncbi:hypothetical protein CsSME_00013440 [Camellia sinensis var. sinensis]
MTIISGYRMAAECARYALLQKVMDNKEDAEKFKEDLMKIAMTTLSSKMLSQDEEHFANLAVDAVMRLQGFMWNLCPSFADALNSLVLISLKEQFVSLFSFS